MTNRFTENHPSCWVGDCTQEHPVLSDRVRVGNKTLIHPTTSSHLRQLHTPASNLQWKKMETLSSSSSSATFEQDSGFRRLSQDQLQHYLTRIGLELGSNPSPSLKLLQDVVYHHACAIPCENAQLFLLKRFVSIEIDDIFQDLVVNQRGGYCFQQNVLMLAALRALGFSAYAGSAKRAMWNAEIQKFNYAGMLHGVLFVTVPTTSKVYLVDVGFFGNGLMTPIELVDGAEVDCVGGEKQKLVQGPLTDALQSGWFFMHHRAEGRGAAPGADVDGWETMYYFTTEPLLFSDYQVLNYYASTHPTFIVNVHLLVVLTKSDDDSRVTLLNRKFHRRHREPTQCESRTIEALDEMVTLLENEFHLVLSEPEIAVLKTKWFADNS